MLSTNRREALQFLIAAGGMAGLPAIAGAAGEDPVFAAYQRNAEQDPWTLIVRDAPADGFSGDAQLIHGQMPSGLSGTLYRNGPGRFSRQGWRYRHWFDGDGFIQSWQLANGRVSHRGQFTQTDKWVEEEAAGRFLRPGFGSLPPGASGVNGPDDMNVANTSVMLVGDELLALWEGGSAWSLDPETLESRGPRRWGQGLDGVPFSAHPKVEPQTGIVWNFGQDAFNDRLVIWKIGPDGQLLDAGLIPDIPGGMVHDFVITERSLVFLVGSYRYQGRADTFNGSFGFEAGTPMLAVVLDKNDWSQRRTWELDPGFLFHFGGAWESADGEIRLDAALSDDARMVSQGAQMIMRGEPEGEVGSHTQHRLVTLGAGGRARSEVLGPDYIEFPQVDPRFVGRRRRQTWHIAWSEADERGATRIERRDLETGTQDGFDHGEHVFVEEPLFLPSEQGAEGEGWVIHTALNARDRRTELHVFDALRLSDGPLASWQLPYSCPFGFHGCWRQA